MRRCGPGKAPGAFSHPTTPSAHPYVLMNYQGKPRDVMTLAHELGHGVHQVLAAKNGALMAPTPLTLAETASVFGEMLTFKRLLARDQEREAAPGAARRQGRGHDQHRGAADRVLYVRAQASTPSGSNGELTAERLGEIWLSVQGESLGPAIDIKPGLRDLLDVHPALHPFAVLRLRLCVRRLPGELALRGLRECAPRGFAERYLAMLAAGGTKHYSELLRPFGLDAKDPTFWDGGLSVHRGHDRRAGGDGLSIGKACKTSVERSELVLYGCITFC